MSQLIVYIGLLGFSLAAYCVIRGYSWAQDKEGRFMFLRQLPERFDSSRARHWIVTLAFVSVIALTLGAMVVTRMMANPPLQ